MCTFETRNNCTFVFGVVLTPLSADEFQLNSKSAYIPKRIHGAHLSAFPTFITLKRRKTKIVGYCAKSENNPVGQAAIVSELDNTSVVAQIREINRLIAPAASECSRTNEVITETTTEQELCNQKECAAEKFINAFKNCHLIRV